MISLFLVGGRFDDGLHGGLWTFESIDSSPSAGRFLGARLLILKLGAWCVCFGRFVSLLELLSAVIGIGPLIVACGVGIVTKLPLLRGRTSELDHLY